MKPIAVLVFGLLPAGLIHSASPLANLPGAEGPTVAQLKALGDNAWLNLGAPAADPKWGRRRGASWTPKMVYAPDLRGAFVSGSGQHCFVKPDSHYDDDLWVYDINGHRWVCAYAGTPVDSLAILNIHCDSNGLEVDGQGNPYCIAPLIHGYQLQSYDVDLRKYVTIRSASILEQNNFCSSSFPGRSAWLPSPCPSATCGANALRHPWYFDVATGKWENPYVATGQEMDLARLEGAPTEYIPGKKQLFHARWDKVFFYDHAANTWTKAAITGTPGQTYDPQACYDTRRNRVIVGKGSDFRAFEIESNRWVQLNSTGISIGSGVDANMTYDSNNDVVVLHNYGNKPFSSEIRIYNPAVNNWSAAQSMPDPGLYSGQFNAFYDPVLNVHFYFGAGDSWDDGVMMAYRYKKGSWSGAEGKSAGEHLDLTVSPNPVRGRAVIQFAGAFRETPLQIFDTRGRWVARTAREWDVSNVPNGVYIIVAKIGNQEFSKRLLVQK